MFFNTYSEGMAACLAGTGKIDGAYVFYTTKEPLTLQRDLEASTITTTHCTESHGILRTKGVVCSGVSDTQLSFTLTSKGGEELSRTSPLFSAGVSIYAIALAVTGNTSNKDILLLSTTIADLPKVPAGADIAFTMTLDLGNGGN